jgi:hypothetical protein
LSSELSNAVFKQPGYNHNPAEQFIFDDSRRSSRSSASTQRTLGSKSETRFIQATVSKNRSASPGEEDEQDDDENEEGPFVQEVPSISMRIGDRPAIENFYQTTFHLVQQIGLKHIEKAWIKELEPNKQKNFPYSGGKPPPWWPMGCTYKEPDHLKKHRV